MKTSEKVQHTPGPWAQPVRYSPEDGCNIPCGAVEDAAGESIAVATWQPDATVAIANARLIAAAPELLAFARRVNNYLSARPSDDDDAVDLSRDADKLIAKAEQS